MSHVCCIRDERLISSAVLGELDESLRASLLIHARECGECGDALDFEADMQAAIDAAPSPAPPPVYFESVLAEIHQAMPARAPRTAIRRRSFRIPREWAATAVMGCLALAILPGILSSEGSGGSESGPYLDAHAGMGMARVAWVPGSAASPALAGPEPRLQVTMLWIPEIGYVSAASGMLEMDREGLAEFGLSLPVVLGDSRIVRWRG